MQNTLVTYLLKIRPHCVFVSPHLDDAGFSAGALISWLVSQKFSLTIINVFTNSAPPPYTLSAKAFLDQCGYSSALQLFTDRRAEDHRIYSKLGVRVINLGYIDSLWRPLSNPSFIRRLVGKIFPEFVNIYPTFRWHIAKGVISKADQMLKSNLTQNIISNSQNINNNLIFAPIGIGEHVDHMVVREACNQSGRDCIYWSDFPYSLYKQPNSTFLENHDLSRVEFSENLDIKREIILGYKSQLSAIFKDKNIPNIPDIYYLPKTMMI